MNNTIDDVNDDPATSRMALVPEKPDEKMIKAGREAYAKAIFESYDDIVKKVWEAMLEASNG